MRVGSLEGFVQSIGGRGWGDGGFFLIYQVEPGDVFVSDIRRVVGTHQYDDEWGCGIMYDD